MFEEEISPEELFRQFFGGGGGMFGGGGGPFGGMGGGPGFVFNVGGGPGIRVHQFGGDRPRRRPHNHENAQPTTPLETLRSLLPLLLLFVLPLLSSLFSDSPGSSSPSIRFGTDAKPPFTLSHTSSRLNVPYWVNPAETENFTPKNWKDLDKVAEGKYVGQLSAECGWENAQRQRIANEAQGFFFTDQAMLDRARRMERPSCSKLGKLGYSTGYY